MTSENKCKHCKFFVKKDKSIPRENFCDFPLPKLPFWAATEFQETVSPYDGDLCDCFERREA